MSIIRIKRSGTTGAPPELFPGEMAYSSFDASNDNLTSGGLRLYIGSGVDANTGLATSIDVIGGEYFTSKLDHAPGTLAANSAIIVDANKQINELLVDKVLIDDSTIGINPNTSFAAANTDLTIASGATGRIIFDTDEISITGQLNTDNIRIDGNTISSTDTNGNILLDPDGSGYVQVVGTNGFVIPVGNTSQQGPSVAGAIRYNSENNQFEGYSGTYWTSLGGVRSVDGLTFITAESDLGVSDDTLFFYTATSNSTNQLSARLDSTNFELLQNTSSTDISSGSLVVTGGVGISENLNVGGDFDVGSGNFTVNATSGDTVTAGDLTVEGDLFVNGNTTTINVSTLEVEDSLIRLAANNTSSDTLDIGFVGNFFDDSNVKIAGLFRNSTDKEWYLFDDYLDANIDDNNIDISSNTFSKGILNTDGVKFSNTVIEMTGDVTGNVTIDQIGGGDGSSPTIITISTTVEPDSVTLGTDTTGNYVQSVSEGDIVSAEGNANTAIKITGTGEGAAVVVAGVIANTSGQVGVATYDATNFDVSAAGVVTIDTIDGGTYGA